MTAKTVLIELTQSEVCDAITEYVENIKGWKLGEITNLTSRGNSTAFDDITQVTNGLLVQADGMDG